MIYKVYDELVLICEDLRKYYDIDKIKTYSVYVFTKDKENELGNNVFDIQSDELVIYDDKHEIIKETLPIIERIQKKLIEIENLRGE